MRAQGRPASSLIEALVFIAVLAILLALLLNAVQAVRASAIRMKSANRLRQIGIAFQNYTISNGDRVPGFGFQKSDYWFDGPFEAILPFLESGNAKVPNPNHVYQEPYIPGYISPADFSFNTPWIDLTRGSPIHLSGDHSYPANWQAVRGGFSLSSSYCDGLSTTIAFAERYSRCATIGVNWLWCVGAYCDWLKRNLYDPTHSNPNYRRPTFADPEYDDDVLPITVNGVTRPSVAGMTFQLAPTIDACNDGVPQTPHKVGMLAVFMDGSVRTISPRVAPEVFWSAVTPAGGEVLAGW